MPDLELLPDAFEARDRKTPQVKVMRGWRTLDGFVEKQRNAVGIAIDTLEAGAALRVHTRHSDYRLVVLDSSKRLVLVKGGTVFPEESVALLDGSTAGGSALKTGWLGVGLRMELSCGTRRIISSPVESIEIEGFLGPSNLAAIHPEIANRSTH